MSEHYRFFGGPVGSEPKYTQANFAEVLKNFLSDGYIPNVEDELEVVESTPAAMTVDVSEGEGWIQGYWYKNDSALSVTIPAADPSNPRIDRIILRLDTATDLKISAECLEGTPAGTPSAPALTQTSSIYEISLAQVLVGAGVTSIVNANITDERTKATAPNTLSGVEDDTSPILGGPLDANDEIISKPVIKDYGETSVAANSGAAYTIDLEDGNDHVVTLTDDCTFTFSNPPASGTAGSFTLTLIQDGTGSRTVTWPGSVKWAGGTAPTLSSGAGEIDIFVFYTRDAGTTWYGGIFGQDFQTPP